jgi:MFS family permease
LLAGALTAAFGWRYAFIVPGTVILLTGIAFLFVIKTKTPRQAKDEKVGDVAVSRAQAIRGLAILSVTVLCVGLLAQATTIGMPKIFAVRAPGVVEAAGLIGAGGLASLALAIGALGQLAGGWLADRYRLTLVYPAVYVVMIPVALLAGILSGLPLVGAAGAVMFLITASLPTENSLVARYCPTDWRASAYGAKFVLGLGVSSLAIPLTGGIYDATGGFWWVFAGMAMLAGVIICFAACLPKAGEHSSTVEEPVAGPVA